MDTKSNNDVNNTVTFCHLPICKNLLNASKVAHINNAETPRFLLFSSDVSLLQVRLDLKKRSNNFFLGTDNLCTVGLN